MTADRVNPTEVVPSAGSPRIDTTSGPALNVKNVSKTFMLTPALDQLDLQIQPGEIHALLGENGSGKSTFIKILSGFHQPDPGAFLEVHEEKLEPGNPQASYRLGCRFVHQDRGLVGTESVLNNLFLNTGFPTRFGTISGSKARCVARGLLDRVGLDIDPLEPVASYPLATQTGVAVARAIREDERHRAHVLVLDEPTATLPESEVESLMDIVRLVAGQGVAVLYVTHRLEEVFELTDNVTVLRDGRRVATQPSKSLDRHGLINLLVGSALEEARVEDVHEPEISTVPILEVRNMRSGPIRDVSFSVQPGEIVGIAGIGGSGREVLLSSIFGGVEREAGSVTVDGIEVRSFSPVKAMDAGVGYLPSDRKVHGGMMELTARENITISNLDSIWRWPILRRRKEQAEAKEWFAQLSIRPAKGYELPLQSFSGGNQQKILFAKWLRRRPRILLLDEPTQGVDVGARVELHRQVLATADEGAGVVVSTSDVDELEALCHRVIVLRDGLVVAELTRKHINVAAISRLSLGADREVLTA
jgi:ribose transport system ATP-binding protein